MDIRFSGDINSLRGCVVLFVTQDLLLAHGATAGQAELQAIVDRAIGATRFEGKRGQVVVIPGPPLAEVTKLVLVGIGDPAEITRPQAEKCGGAAFQKLGMCDEVTVLLGEMDLDVGLWLASGMVLRSYRFIKYKTKADDEDASKASTLTILTAMPDAAAERFAAIEALMAGVFLARDLVNEPANVIYPDSFVEIAKSLSAYGVDVRVIDDKEMRSLGMGGILGVGQGSIHPPRLLILEWCGHDDPAASPLVIVGKGVCFDSGGISLKPMLGMWDMKYDLSGAAAVAGTMLNLARRKARVRVIGLCGLVENMPDAMAQRPGDVIVSMSGQTVEVQNTDAEGRLVLCDVLWYARETFNPCALIDLATLTGAIKISLGEHYAGLFSNDDDLAEKISSSGTTCGERAWRFPLGDEYGETLKSLIADMKNIGDGKGNSIIAAEFLKRFVGDTPWAHLDIAGTAWSEKGTPLSAPGATGYGVRLLDKIISAHFERS